MKTAQSALLVLLALTALAAVASAYEPIADNKVPSPKTPVRAATSRKLLQQGARASSMASKDASSFNEKPGVLWGGYVVTPPFWVAGMENMKRDTPNIESEKLFSRVAQ